MSDDVFDTWNATTDDELTFELVKNYFSELWDELYIASAAIDRVVDDVKLQRFLLERAIAATDGAIEDGKGALTRELLLQEANAEIEEGDRGEALSIPKRAHVEERLARLLALRALALERLDLLDSFVFISSDSTWLQVDDTPDDETEGEKDPWADGEADFPTVEESLPPLTLPEFLSSDLLTSVVKLVGMGRFVAVRWLMNRHPSTLYPYRFFILETIPPFLPPQKYAPLLPSVDHALGMERSAPTPQGRSTDWVETSEARKLYLPTLQEHYAPFSPSINSSAPALAHPLSLEELSTWYRTRINYMDGEMGLTDIALELVQHGASQGIPGLDEIGEELSLVARLIYDTPGADQSRGDRNRWSLARWHALTSDEVVKAYLFRSSPSTVADDIRRLVMPYLFVLEARAERAGSPDPDLPKRHIFEYILTAPLPLCAAIFEASKPTTPSSQRIIHDDEDLARLALARLYGATELDQWSAMSYIFECLPDWPAPSPETIEDGALSADTTLASLASFVQPSASRAHSSSPIDLFVFFKPLQSAALSRALDILDMHLECGEILARWGVPAPLAWFFQSAFDERQQRAWATRMARRSILVQSDADAEEPDRDKRRDDGTTAYRALLKDMLKLVGPSGEKIRGVFQLLAKDDVTKIFFSGLLSSGKFSIAKKFLHDPNVRKLDSKTIEDLCLSASREFYDNASSGNIHHDDMKLAYDCLSVPTQTEAILAERQFIEATSRICSFKVVSQPGIPITPIEIRLQKDRLNLVARVLSENEDAYKYPDVIMELVHKLGYKKGDIASEVKVHAMLADSALHAEDFESAASTVEMTVALLASSGSLPSSSRSFSAVELNPPETTNASMAEGTEFHSPQAQSQGIDDALEVCWHSCFQLGRQTEYHDTKRKLRLLGHALRICPPENTVDILAVWRRLEQVDIEENTKHGRKALRVSGGRSRPSKPGATNGNGSGRLAGFGSPDLAALSGRAASLLGDYTPSEHLLHQGADVARQTLSRVAANFPLSSLRGIGGRSASTASEGDGSSARPSTTRSITPEISASARQVLSRGMGWLIGDDE